MITIPHVWPHRCLVQKSELFENDELLRQGACDMFSPCKKKIDNRLDNPNILPEKHSRATGTQEVLEVSEEKKHARMIFKCLL